MAHDWRSVDTDYPDWKDKVDPIELKSKDGSITIGYGGTLDVFSNGEGEEWPGLVDLKDKDGNPICIFDFEYWRPTHGK